MVVSNVDCPTGSGRKRPQTASRGIRNQHRKTEVLDLFIAHDLSVVKHISHQVAVMYLGRVVESGPKKVLFGNPLHPYTRALFDAIPVPDPLRRRPKRSLRGDLPSPLSPPPGCAFNPRCPFADERCRQEAPQMLASQGATVACHAVEEGRLPRESAA